MPARMPPNNDHLSLDLSKNILNSHDEHTTYRLLIDAYRIFDEDTRIGTGSMQNPAEGYYEGMKYCTGYKFGGLKELLDNAEKGKLLPSWWSKEKRKECEMLAMQLYHWSDVETSVGVEVNEAQRYGGPSTWLSLRKLIWELKVYVPDDSSTV
jgi:hypothetical protein